LKSKLQYLYSISVFAGVLLTAYFMMNGAGNSRLPLQALRGNPLRTDAAIDPAVQQLIQMEQELVRIKKAKQEIEQKRLPSEIPR
jgi:hypothetical protein